MSIGSVCRLCVNMYVECKSLFDSDGRNNDVYDITVKYFDPMVLNLESGKESTVICLTCWSHIKAFHDFQSSILLAQTQLLEDVKHIEPIVKMEYMFSFDATTDMEMRAVNRTATASFHDGNDCHDEEDEKVSLDIPDVPALDMSCRDQSSSDDDLPLMERFAKGKAKRRIVRKSSIPTISKDVATAIIRGDTVKKSEHGDTKCCGIEKISEDSNVTMAINSKIEKICKESISSDDDVNDSIPSPDLDNKHKAFVAPRNSEVADDISSLKQDPSESVSNPSQSQQSEHIMKDTSIRAKRKTKDITHIKQKYKDDLNSLENAKHQSKKTNAKTLEWDDFIAQWKDSLECIHCSKTAKDFATLRKHFKSHHPDEKFYVHCCERRFTKRFTLYEHIKLHLDPNSFQCHVCGKCSTSSTNLAKHIKELHTEEGKLRPFQCNVCEKCFSCKTNLRIHMEVHASSRDHICSECGKGFPSDQRRKIHERMVHNVDRICDQCGKSFHGVYALKQHLLEHRGIEKTKWPCDICGAKLNSHSSRKRHMQLKHNDGTTAYICRECRKVFSSEPALLGHKRIAHMNVLKYKCVYCEKAFKTPRNLREHVATHTGVDLYQCPHCPKTFKMSSNMHHHRKKVHPVEWAEGRVNKTTRKLNLSLVSNEVII